VLRVLDSTVLIDFLRGRPAVGRVIGLRTSGDVPATTAINVEEIVRGLRTDETEAARRLFSGLIILPIDSRAAWQAGMWRRKFAARGMTCIRVIAWLPRRPGHTKAPWRLATRRTSL
jgi:predicted nucleic acid-binding protein